MRASSVMITVVKSLPFLAHTTLDLFWTYITLGSWVRKTRKAFEKQLVIGGMSKDDARRLSACFEDLKDSLTAMMKQEIAGTLTHHRSSLSV